MTRKLTAREPDGSIWSFPFTSAAPAVVLEKIASADLPAPARVFLSSLVRELPATALAISLVAHGQTITNRSTGARAQNIHVNLTLLA